MKNNVLIQPGLVIISGGSVDAMPHTHNAMQVVWPQERSICQLNNKPLSGLVVIDSNIEHQLQMDHGWILLVEPKSQLGEQLKLQLNGQSYQTFNLANFDSDLLSQREFKQLLTPLFEHLSLSHETLVVNKPQINDHRISQFIDGLDRCLGGDCIKPASWRAAQVAQQLALSESRFLHLFRQELGISWRPYLMWRRLICAMQALLNGLPATDAAYLAGFSDSAHLSRTFKKTFGMTIRQASVLFKES